MALSGIEIGGWRLEHEKEPIVFTADKDFHRQAINLFALAPEYLREHSTGSILSATNQQTGKNIQFSVYPQRTRDRDGDTVHYYQGDVRIFQAVRVGRTLLQLGTIIHTNDLALFTPPEYRGGRRLLSASPSSARPQTPSVTSQHELLEVVEDLCPITPTGILTDLHTLTDMLDYEKRAEHQRQVDAFELLAREAGLQY